MPLEWNDFPPRIGASDMSSYPYLIQIAKPIQERFDIPNTPGAPHAWPSGSTPYDSGTITAATDDGSTWTITDSNSPAKNWDNDSKPFTTGPNDDWAATAYSVVIFIDADDPRKVVRADITAN